MTDSTRLSKGISKLAAHKFSVVTLGVASSQLILDFAPILAEFNPDGVLLHWQSRPKGHREWGLYEIATDNYYSCPDIQFNRVAEIELLQLNDRSVFTIPSAVVCLHNSSIRFNDSLAIIYGRS